MLDVPMVLAGRDDAVGTDYPSVLIKRITVIENSARHLHCANAGTGSGNELLPFSGEGFAGDLFDKLQ